MSATKKKLVAVVNHRVGVALDEGPRIRHRNRLTVRGLVQVSSSSSRPAPTCSAAITAGMNETGTIEGARTLATCATGGYLVISLMSDDDEIRFRLLRAVV
jgi:hypothetical protein